jgi:ABC-type transport system involved in multi-copper enzyme maturation permease subunit
MNAIFCLAGIVIKELYRRKDFYVLFVITAVITLLMGTVTFFHQAGIVRYLKDICLLLIWVSSLVIAIVTTARQIPAECESRTILPLLAKPVSRWQVVAGKFTGCWLACGLALVVFYLFFGAVCAAKEGRLPLAQYFQAFWLQWAMLAVVVSLALLGSVVFSAPSANATICFSVVAGILLVGAYLEKLAALQPPILAWLLTLLYFTIPHLEWFYAVRERLVFDQDLIAWGDCALATAYAAAYVGVILCAAWLLFRRKPLTA